LRCRISARKKESLRILGRNGLESGADCGEKGLLRSGFARPQMGLDLAPHLLYGVEVGAVGRKELQSGAARFDEGFRFFVLVGREIVDDNDVAVT